MADARPIIIPAPTRMGTTKTPRTITSIIHATKRSQNPAYARVDTEAGNQLGPTAAAAASGAPPATATDAPYVDGPQFGQAALPSAIVLPHFEQYTACPPKCAPGDSRQTKSYVAHHGWSTREFPASKTRKSVPAGHATKLDWHARRGRALADFFRTCYSFDPINADSINGSGGPVPC